MNETEFDRRLHQWLRGGPSSASPRVLAAVVDHVRTRRPDGDLRSRLRNLSEAVAAHRPAPIVLRPIVLLALLALAFAVGVFAYGRWQEINRVVTPVPSPAPTAPPVSPQPTSLVQTSFVCPRGTQPDQPGPSEQLRPVSPTHGGGTAIDRQSGVLVYPTDSTLWLFDLCSNTWRTSEAILAGSAPGLAVYDADSDRIVVFGSEALTIYDADTDTARQLPPLVGNIKAAVYDPVSGLIFGLSDDGTGRLSTYDVDQDTWQAVESSGDIPPVTSAVLMAYDTSAQRIVLYQGMGMDAGTATYEFDPQTSRWTRQAIVTPSMVFVWGDIVRGGEIAYDEARARTIVFSRGKLIAYDASLHDWETVFDSPMDAVWPASGSNNPSHRQEAALAYDPVHQRTLAIGGRRFMATGDWVDVDDVIAFDLGTRSWLELLGPSADIPVGPTPSPEAAGCPVGTNPDQPGPTDQLRPPAGALGPVAFDRQAGRVVAFSDADGEGALWAFDVCTNTWSRSSAQVPTVGAMVYDEVVGQVLLLGNTDLLTYDAQADATTVDARLPSVLWSRPVGAVYRSWSDQLIVRNEDASPLPGHSQLWACSHPPAATCYELPESGDIPRPGGSQQLLGYDASVDALVLYLDRQGIFEAYEYSFQTSVWTRQAEQPPAVPLDAGWIPWDARWDIAYDEEHALSVILGNARLVTFDAATWYWQVVIDAADAPVEARRLPAAMVYDPLNRRVLAIGGYRYGQVGEPAHGPTDDVLAFDLEDNSLVTLLGPSSQ